MASYYVYSGAGGSNNGSSWANAFTTLTTAFATEVAGDTLYVAHDHAESTAAAITLTSSGTIANTTKVVCVNRAGSVPPVSADRMATAQVSTSGTSPHINLNGFVHYDGIIFTAGGTGATHIIITSSGTASLRFDNCSLRLGSTTSTNRIYIGNAGATGGTYVELNNTTISFANSGQRIDLSTRLRWSNTPSALIGAGMPPGTLFVLNNNRGGGVECIGVDLSAATGSTTLVDALAAAQAVEFMFTDCKLHASVVKSLVPTSHGSTQVDFVRSSSSGVNYTIYSHRVGGLLIEETTIVRTGGASDGTTPIAWKIVTTANCMYSFPFECPPIAVWNDTIGSSVTATVEGIWGGGAVPNDDEVWLDVEYLGSSSSPQGSFVNDGKADLLTAAAGQTSSSETWGGSTTKFKLACTFTPQMKGWVYARVKVGKASSTFYLDPLVTLS